MRFPEGRDGPGAQVAVACSESRPEPPFGMAEGESQGDPPLKPFLDQSNYPAQGYVFGEPKVSNVSQISLFVFAEAIKKPVMGFCQIVKDPSNTEHRETIAA